MTTPLRRVAQLLLLFTGLLGPWLAAAEPAVPGRPPALPPAITAALGRARLDSDSLALWIAPVGQDAPRLAHQPDRLVHPASLMKLVTSSVALDLLGPTHVWTTGVYLDGPVERGVLRGSLWLQGRGDPKLVHERLWLLLRQVRQLGVQEIRGDIVIDRSAFQIPPVDPGAFDGERYRPYNVRPDALLINQKSLLLRLRPEPARGVAHLSAEPPLDGVQIPATVPLATGSDCNDWRTTLQPDFSDPARLRFAGRYAPACGEKIWPLAYTDPASYTARVLRTTWEELGGRLRGRIREAQVPPGWLPAFEFSSPTLAEVVRDMNKHSNNVIAQQLFLTLGLTQRGLGTFEAAREVSLARVQERAGCRADELRLDNGSGLSRDERITAHCLARVLQWAWASPWMPELLASLPIAGIETTARRATSVSGRAHLKTGSLANVAALAGVIDPPGRVRQVVIAIINHPQVGSDEARLVLDSVLRWAIDEKDGAP